LITANTIDLQGDGNIGGNGEIRINPGGILTKSGGTGTFGFGNNVNSPELSGVNFNLVVKSGELDLSL
jgi:hypothetical protein